MQGAAQRSEISTARCCWLLLESGPTGGPWPTRLTAATPPRMRMPTWVTSQSLAPPAQGTGLPCSGTSAALPPEESPVAHHGDEAKPEHCEITVQRVPVQLHSSCFFGYHEMAACVKPLSHTMHLHSNRWDERHLGDCAAGYDERLGALHGGVQLRSLALGDVSHHDRVCRHPATECFLLPLLTVSSRLRHDHVKVEPLARTGR